MKINVPQSVQKTYSYDELEPGKLYLDPDGDVVYATYSGVVMFSGECAWGIGTNYGPFVEAPPGTQVVIGAAVNGDEPVAKEEVPYDSPEARADRIGEAAATLLNDFTWDETDQGSGYWCNVYSNLERVADKVRAGRINAAAY